jgi:hypothetical protein
LTRDRSAEAPTVVLAVEELFPGTGSAVALDTTAVFDNVPATTGAVTATVIVGAVAPVTSNARVHVTDTFPLFAHAHPAPDADTNVTPAGNVSTTDTAAASDGPLSDTTRVYATDPPATTLAGPDFTTARSADAVTVVLAVEVLFPGTGSAVADDTDAEFDNDPACAGAVTVTVITGALVPVASVGRVHVTETLPAFVHVHPAPDADTNVVPAGSVSVTDTAVASDGPLSVTVNAYATAPPATTVAGPVFSSDRSADPATEVVAVEVLFPGTGSAVADDTVAEFVRVTGDPGAVTVTVIVGAVVPVASAARVQVTETLPTFVHVHPAPDAETKVTPAGSVSRTDSDAASEGPRSLTTRLYVTVPPAGTEAVPVLTSERSAEAVTVVDADELLFPGTGSAVAEVTDAVFVTEPACAGAVTTTVMVGAVAPVTRAGRVQVTETLPAFVQVQPAPLAETNPTPAGRVSVTVSDAASDGPAFATTSE